MPSRTEIVADENLNVSDGVTNFEAQNSPANINAGGLPDPALQLRDVQREKVI